RGRRARASSSELLPLHPTLPTLSRDRVVSAVAPAQPPRASVRLHHPLRGTPPRARRHAHGVRARRARARSVSGRAARPHLLKPACTALRLDRPTRFAIFAFLLAQHHTSIPAAPG